MDDAHPNYSLFREEHAVRGTQWCCVWIDHAERHVRRWLGPASLSQAEAERLASKEFLKYGNAHVDRLAKKRSMSDDELDELRQRSTFPRAVVAFHITRLCNRIVQAEGGDDTRSGRLGLQLFSDRTGISPREVHRLIEDCERVAVGYDTVDKICSEFAMIFDDFIDDAILWAAMEGPWAYRASSLGLPAPYEDSWPVGYEIAQPKTAPRQNACALGSFDII